MRQTVVSRGEPDCGVGAAGGGSNEAQARCQRRCRRTDARESLGDPTHDDVVRAIEKLDKWANVDLGGSSGMPTAYVSIKDWIARRQQDPDSVYSCL